MRWLKRVLWVLLGSLLLGFAIGTVLRVRLERPVRYIGSALPPYPLDIALASSAVLDPGHDEEQVG